MLPSQDGLFLHSLADDTKSKLAGSECDAVWHCVPSGCTFIERRYFGFQTRRTGDRPARDTLAFYQLPWFVDRQGNRVGRDRRTQIVTISGQNSLAQGTQAVVPVFRDPNSADLGEFDLRKKTRDRGTQ